MLVVNNAISGLAPLLQINRFKRRRQNVDKMGEYFVDVYFCICTFLRIKHDAAAAAASIPMDVSEGEGMDDWISVCAGIRYRGTPLTIR